MLGRVDDPLSEIGDRRNEANMLGNLGSVYYNQGQYKEAISHYEQSIEIFRSIANPRGEGIQLGNLGIVYSSIGQYEQAITYYTESIAIARDIGSRSSEGNTLGNLGTMYVRLGQYEQAIDCYKQAIKLIKEVGNKRYEGVYLGNLGDCLIKIGNVKKAEDVLPKAIQLCETIFPVAAGAFMGSLAMIKAQNKCFDEALSLMVDGEERVRVNPLEYGKFLCKKSQVLHLAHQQEAAKEAFRQAVQIAEDLQLDSESELRLLIQQTERCIND